MSVVRFSGILVWLTVLWVLLWGDLSVANVASGLAVGVAVLVFARLPAVARSDDPDVARVSIPHLLWFGVYVVYKLIESNMVLAWEIVTPRNRINTGVIAVPLRTQSNLAMMTVANVITLTPGTMTLEAHGDPAVLYVHVLHLHDVERVRADLLKLEDLSVQAFGSRRARDQLSSTSRPAAADHSTRSEP